MQGLVMLLCIYSKDDDIIANVLDIGDVTNSSSNYILKFSSCSIHAKTKALVPVQTKMSGEGGDVPGLGVQDQLVISLIEIEFAKHVCTTEVVYYFIKGRHEESFLGYCFVRFPHVHAQPYSTGLFGLTPLGCLGFGTKTTGDTQEVDPLAGSVISCCNRDSTQASRFFR